MTVATTDGDTTWAFRYSSVRQSRSLFHSTDISTLRHQYPDNPVLHDLSDDARLVVSEPLGDLQGAWREVGSFDGPGRGVTMAQPRSQPPVRRPWASDSHCRAYQWSNMRESRRSSSSSTAALTPM
jgi:hypothetical protein